jgi:hypothetical protein
MSNLCRQSDANTATSSDHTTLLITPYAFVT